MQIWWWSNLFRVDKTIQRYYSIYFSCCCTDSILEYACSNIYISRNYSTFIQLFSSCLISWRWTTIVAALHFILSYLLRLGVVLMFIWVLNFIIQLLFEVKAWLNDKMTTKPFKIQVHFIENYTFYKQYKQTNNFLYFTPWALLEIPELG